jgi:hypothetical protein
MITAALIITTLAFYFLAFGGAHIALRLALVLLLILTFRFCP